MPPPPAPEPPVPPPEPPGPDPPLAPPSPLPPLFAPPLFALVSATADEDAPQISNSDEPPPLVAHRSSRAPPGPSALSLLVLMPLDGLLPPVKGAASAALISGTRAVIHSGSGCHGAGNP